MKAQQLKNAILQLAIQGKLVPQDPTDEPASVLLEKIKQKKDRLIAEGKIKKSKKTSDKTPSTTEQDFPFEIPESWVWVRLEDIFHLQVGRFISALRNVIENIKVKMVYLIFPQKMFMIKTVLRGLLMLKTLIEEDYFLLSKKFGPQRNDIIFARYGTIGVGKFYSTENIKLLVSYSCAFIKVEYTQYAICCCLFEFRIS